MSLLVNRRRGVGKSLPYDAEVEWISNEGTSYIDTLYKPSNNSKYEIVFKNVGGKTSQAVFGSRDNYTTKNTSLWVDVDSVGLVRVTKGTRSNWYGFDRSIATIGKRIHFTMDKTIATMVVDNNTYTWTYPNTAFQSDYNIFIFTQNNGGAIQSGWSAYVEIESFKIWENNDIVRDYIPVRIGQVGYLYDKVTKKLFGDVREIGFSIGRDK